MTRYQVFRNTREENSYERRREELGVHIQKALDDSYQIFGIAKITADLREQGINTTIETVRQLNCKAQFSGGQAKRGLGK